GGQVEVRPQPFDAGALQLPDEVLQDRFEPGAGNRQAEVPDRRGVQVGFLKGGCAGHGPVIRCLMPESTGTRPAGSLLWRHCIRRPVAERRPGAPGKRLSDSGRMCHTSRPWGKFSTCPCLPGKLKTCPTADAENEDN